MAREREGLSGDIVEGGGRLVAFVEVDNGTEISEDGC